MTIIGARMSIQPELAPRRRALIAAGVVFVLGYGALSLASAIGLGDDSLPGLYTFRSATVGDGLLLPLLAYSLVRAAGRTWERNEKRSILTASAVGVLVGVMVQVQWLADPQPTINWTLPAAGTFNAVGWYHAGFLVATCGFFGGATVAAIARLRRELTGTLARTRSVGILCVLAPALAFVALLAEDNGALDVLDIAVWLVPLTALAIAGLIWASRHTTAWSCALVCLAALLPAISVSLLFLPGRVSETLTVLPAVCAALVGAAGTSVLALGAGMGRIVVPLYAAACAAGPVYAFAGMPTTTVTRLTICCAVSVVVVMVELLLLRVVFENRSVRARTIVLMPLVIAPIIAYGLAGRLFGQEPDRIGQYAVIVAFVVTALYLWVSASPVRSTFNAVIAAEQANLGRDRLADLKWTAYSTAILTYAGAMLACVVVLIGTSAGKWITGSADGWGSLLLPAVTMAALVMISASVRKAIATVVRPASCLVWAILMGSRLLNGYGDWKQAVLSIVAAVAVGLFVFEGVISNTAYLHNQSIDRRNLVTAVCAALTAGLTMAWLTGPSLWSAGTINATFPALLSVVIGVPGCIVLPWLAARALPGATPPRVYRTATPTQGVFQDCLLATLLGLSLAWAPNLFLAHLNDVAPWVGAAVPFMALLTAAYMNILKNNIGHVHRERRRVADIAAQTSTTVPADELSALDALAKHIRRQNIIALVALFPFGAFALASEINAFSEEGIWGALKRITSP